MAFLKKGDKAPEFTGINQNGDEVRLSDFRGKRVILYFYPKDNTPGCTAESCSLRDGYDDLRNKGFEVIGVSPDSAASHTNFRAKYDLPFTLLADSDKTILKAYGAWGMKKNYGREYEGVLRTTYVISETGSIEEVITKVNTKDAVRQVMDVLGID